MTGFRTVWAVAWAVAWAVGFAIAGQRLQAQRPPRSREPFPAHAAGFGPPAGGGLFHCRWAEDWSEARTRGTAPPGKAMPLAHGVSLTVSAESRARVNRYTNARLRAGDDATEGLWRGVLGADLRFGEHVRVYGEFASGSIRGGLDEPAPNFANDLAVSQAFVDVRGNPGGLLVGAMLGRQEFADGPRQLLSLSDGPNLHRTWNGVRGYVHGERARVSAFALWATHLGADGFDESVDEGQRLHGVTGSIVLAGGERGAGTFVEPFWLHSRVPDVRVHGRLHDDRRDTLGVRLFGRAGRFGFDATAAQQLGSHGDRAVAAWGAFSRQDVLLADVPWQPRATLRVDVASGGGPHGGVHTFQPLHASSNYVSEGRLLALANLVLVGAGVTMAPTADSRLSAEWAVARRFASDDAVHGGGLRAYPGTASVGGAEIGWLLRVEGRWNGPANLVVACGYERLVAGEVLGRAGLPGADYAFASVTIRY